MLTVRNIMIAAVAAGAALTVCNVARAADVSSEIMNARMHAGLAAQASDLATMHAHLHHALNCLVGPQGSGFDAKELNPCQNNGNGAIPDETDAGKKKSLQAAADKASTGIQAGDLSTARSDASSVATMLGGVK